jgi:hypothetical protein
MPSKAQDIRLFLKFENINLKRFVSTQITKSIGYLPNSSEIAPSEHIVKTGRAIADGTRGLVSIAARSLCQLTEDGHRFCATFREAGPEKHRCPVGHRRRGVA